MTTTAAEAELLRSGPRRWGTLFAAFWMFYLLPALQAGWDLRGSVRGWVGMVALVAFAAVYLGCFVRLRGRRPVGTPFRMTVRPVTGLVIVGGELALAVLVCATVGQKGTATAVYVAVTAMLCLPGAVGWGITGAIAVGAYAAGRVVPGWNAEPGLFFGIVVAALAIWGIGQAISRNIEVLAVREENARLALEDQKTRFARDLHDILGHSLTVITVKAELAQRLLDVDTDRTRAELADLERLSRDALADVRRAVEGYREITLPAELARARNALAAAGIEPVLPNSVDEVPGEVREVFAWTVREGVTNVIRHSGAQRCEVRLRPDEVEVRDDGRGPSTPSGGHGLVGLTERAAAIGGRVETVALDPGFSLKVVVP